MAAPTVGAVLEDILPYLGVKQTEDAPANQPVVLSDFTGLTREEAQAKLKEQGLTASFRGIGLAVTAQIPAAEQSVPGNSEVILYCGEDPVATEIAVPDFTGMNRQQANDAAANAGLYIQIKGNTDVDVDILVTDQSVPFGNRVPLGTTIALTFTDTKASD